MASSDYYLFGYLEKDLRFNDEVELDKSKGLNFIVNKDMGGLY